MVSPAKQGRLDLNIEQLDQRELSKFSMRAVQLAKKYCLVLCCFENDLLQAGRKDGEQGLFIAPNCFYFSDQGCSESIRNELHIEEQAMMSMQSNAVHFCGHF